MLYASVSLLVNILCSLCRNIFMSPVAFIVSEWLSISAVREWLMLELFYWWLSARFYGWQNLYEPSFSLHEWVSWGSRLAPREWLALELLYWRTCVVFRVMSWGTLCEEWLPLSEGEYLVFSKSHVDEEVCLVFSESRNDWQWVNKFV